MNVTRKSMLSGKVRTMDLNITSEQVRRYYDGNVLIQDAFPQLSAADREFILTGITDEEWNATFGNEEYEDESE